MFQTIDNKKISQIIIEQIQEMVMTGELKSGDKLPPERELTETFGVGRSALREALKALEAIGVIERVHGQGNFISGNMTNSFFKPLSMAFKLNDGKAEDILQVRYLLETYTARMAAEIGTDDEIRRLEEIQESMRRATSLDKKAVHDRAFHFQIADMSKNTLVISMFQSVSYLLDEFISATVRMSEFEGDDIERVQEEHDRIIDAIRRRDPEDAQKAIRSHLDHVNLDLAEPGKNAVDEL